LILQGFDTIELIVLSETQLPPPKDVWFTFEIMHHIIVLHQYWSCVYDILGNKELGD
jgi:hypothetical protein